MAYDMSSPRIRDLVKKSGRAWKFSPWGYVRASEVEATALELQYNSGIELLLKEWGTGVYTYRIRNEETYLALLLQMPDRIFGDKVNVS